MVQMFVLYESAAGYALFEVEEFEKIAQRKDDVQAAVLDMSKFGAMVKFKAILPFGTAEAALQNINDISEGIVHDDLRNFLEMNLPKVKVGKKAKHSLGVIDVKIGQAITEALHIPVTSNETVLEIIRGIRLHFSVFVKELANMGIEKAQLGLGHSYSRAKVKFNVNRADNMIIQSIALLDQMDKDINTFAMRVREWYSWHFPELVKIVNDNFVYARCAEFIKHRSSLNEDGKEEGLREILLDDDKAAAIMHASKISMGMDVSEVDMVNILDFTRRIISLGLYRKQLQEYLHSKMNNVAPNLAALIGDTVAARLISHAGSLTNLAKCPASTVQILGAEKALFRALKTRGNTPKYGLIFHSSFISRANAKNKGRISRYLANKCSIASRIDSFIDEPTTKYGEKMREQVEERLEFYNTGAAPRKNIDVMKVVSDELKAAAKQKKSEEGGKKKKKRKASDVADVPAEEGTKKKKKKKSLAKTEDAPMAVEESSTTPLKKKKKKKSVGATPEAAAEAPTSEKKKKKKKKSVSA